MNPDYSLVLPGHLTAGVLQRKTEFLAGGSQMIFPIPKIEFV